MTARTTRWLRIGAITAAVLAILYAAAGFLLVPWLAQRYLPGWLGQRLGAEVSVGDFRFNPFTLDGQARQVVISQTGEPPIVSIGRLHLGASVSGLLRQARTIDSLALDGVQVRVTIGEAGPADVVQLARHWQATAPPTSQPSQELALDQVAVSGGQVHLTAVQDGTPVHATVGPIALQANGLTTSAQADPGSFVLEAGAPGGGTLTASGSLRLQPGPVVQGRLDAERLRLQALEPLLRPLLPVARLQAQASAGGSYRYDGEGLSLSEVTVDATEVDARWREPGAVLQAAHIVGRGGALGTGRRTARFDELRLVRGQARIDLAGGGPKPEPRSADGGGAPSPPWSLEVGRLALEGMDLHAAAPQGSAPMAIDVAGLQGQVHLQAAPGASPPRLVASDLQAQWNDTTVRVPGSPLRQLSIGSAAIEAGAVDLAQRQLRAGLLRIAEASVSLEQAPAAGSGRPRVGADDAAKPWDILVERLQLSHVGGQYALPPSAGPDSGVLRVGSVDGQLRVEATVGGPRAQVAASGIDAVVRDVALPGRRAGEPAVHVRSARIAGGRVDPGARELAARKLVLAGALRLLHDAGGFQLATRGAAPAAGGPAGGGAAGDPWRYAIADLQVEALDLQLEDRTVRPALAVAGVLKGSARDVVPSGKTSFDGSLALAAGGTLAASGSADLGAGHASARLRAKGVALAPFEPLLARYASVSLPSGALSGTLQVDYGGAGDLQAGGDLAVADLLLQERGSGAHILSFKQLHVQDASLDLRGGRLTTGDVTLRQPRLKLVVSEDRTLNLAQILGRGPASDTPPAREGGQGLQVLVGRLQLHGGEVDFADHSLVLPFSTTVRNVEGTIVDLSNLPSRRAVVQAQGDIAPHGSAKVEGSFLPAAPGEFTRLDVQFANVRVPPLSPYTATFAGRKVDAGKLWLDLDYHVEDGELRGSNDVRLSDFRLGERVEAPNALDVPLDMVVGLLQDESGTIRLSVPVTGQVGDPQFSVASAVGQAVGNVLRRAVTAPFRLLGRLFGDRGESLAQVEFPAGSASLRPQAQEKLEALAQALQARPGLTLAVRGPYDPSSDAQALREQQARRELARALGRAGGTDDDPGPFAFDDPATQQALERLLRSAAGEAAVQDVRRRFAGGGDTWAMNEAMLARLAAEQPLADSATHVLAVQRARRIAEFLARQGIDGSRVQTGGLASVDADEEGHVASRLQVAASTR